MSGVSAALVEYSAFIVLFNGLNAPIVLSNSLSFLCGLIVSFTLNKFWVFTINHSGFKQFTSYFALALVNLGLSNLFVLAATEGLNIAAPIAKFGAMAMIALWNYFLFGKLVFKQRG